jgi:thymidylate synthase (FAD)
MLEPQVRLITYTPFNPRSMSFSDYPKHMHRWFATNTIDPRLDYKNNNPELLIEMAGRNCYQSWDNPGDKTNQEYVRNLMRQGHLSVIEHVSATFLITNISRSCSHEIVRHRHFSYSQLSQRYFDESHAPFILPDVIEANPDAKAAWEEATNTCQNAYQTLVSCLSQSLASGGDKLTTHLRKVIRQAARSVLPNATETKILMTGNLRSWRHFINLRATDAADTEINRVAIEILAKLRKYVAPTVFEDYRVETGIDGRFIAKTELPYG